MRTPILLIAFNRPENTQMLVERLVEVGAENIYAFVDGPRPQHKSDRVNVARTRRIITTTTWPQTIALRFRAENLGCRKGVTDAINWFFENETEGIILEDDCLPDNSFFEFSTQLLQRYRFDTRVGAICGTTHFPMAAGTRESYRYIRYPHLWGWATWRRAWQVYDSDLTTWGDSPETVVLKTVSGGSKLFRIHWRRLLNRVKSGHLDSWGYVWFYSFWRAGFLAVSPRVNLVTNTGFGEDATHTKYKPMGRNFRPTAETISPPFVRPSIIAPDQQLEALTRWLVFGVAGKRVRSIFRLAYALRNNLEPDR